MAENKTWRLDIHCQAKNRAAATKELTMSMIAAALDAVPKLSALLIDLIERVKDRQTAALVQQIQSLHQTVIGANSELLSENAKLKAENAELKKQLV